MALQRIGVLTGGGDCPGLNAAIRAVVKSAIRTADIEVVGIADGFSGLLDGNSRPLTESDVSGILQRGGTILGSSNRIDPFRYGVGMREGATDTEDRSAEVETHCRRLKLDGLAVIGGDGTMSIAAKFSKRGLPIVGIPKTIDNDLDHTDMTIGYDTALSVATEAVDRLHTTAESHDRVMVLEVMGRTAGWIALRAGIAGGGDIILIPEIPYTLEKVCGAIHRRMDQGKRFSIVVVAEGARPEGGEIVSRRFVPGSPDPVRMGGIGNVVAQQIELCSGRESRVTVLGHLQRGGSPSPFDRWLATRLGSEAVELMLRGDFGRMVCLRGMRIESVPLSETADRPRRIQPGGEEVRAARAVGTSFGD